MPDSYQRYLKNFFLDALKLTGTPLELSLKSSENPYSNKKNKLTPGQIEKRRRLKRFIKKKHSKK